MGDGPVAGQCVDGQFEPVHAEQKGFGQQVGEHGFAGTQAFEQGFHGVGEGDAQVQPAEGGVALDRMQGAEEIGDQARVAGGLSQEGDVALDPRHLVGEYGDEVLQPLAVPDSRLKQISDVGSH